MKDDTYWGPIEMMHRVLALVQVLTKSAPDHFKGPIKDGSLYVNDFVENRVAGEKFLMGKI